MFHCLPNVKETKKKRIFSLSPNLGHSWGGGEAEMESGNTFLLFFKPFPKWLKKKEIYVE